MAQNFLNLTKQATDLPCGKKDSQVASHEFLAVASPDFVRCNPRVISQGDQSNYKLLMVSEKGHPWIPIEWNT